MARHPAVVQPATTLDRLRAGSTGIPAMQPLPPLKASPGRKPWPERDDVPYKGDDDPDGGPMPGTDLPYEYAPGDGEHRAPNPDPDGDHLNLRSALMEAAVGHKDQEAARALLAIEARLAEIMQFMKSARQGTPPGVTFKLDVLAHII